MMKRWGIILFLLCSAGMIQAQSKADDLHDLLFNEDCSTICWLGIKVHETTEAELQRILSANGLSYSMSPLTEEANSYDVGNGNVAIITEASGTVGFVSVWFADTYVSDVIDVFGYPDRVIKDQNSSLVYSDKGIAIVLYHDSDQVSTVEITSPEFVQTTFIDELSPVYEILTECSDSSQLCQIVKTINNPAENPAIAEIRDSITDDTCQRTCWLGIEPGITTIDELEVILENLGYPFYKQTRTNSEIPTYMMRWFQTDNIPYGYIRPESSSVILTDEDGLVSAVYIGVRGGISLDDALTLFDKAPDIVSTTQSYVNYQLYEEEGVVIESSEGAISTVNEVFQIGLIDSKRVNILLGYEDIRPCTEPVSLCNTPFKTSPSNPISDTTPEANVTLQSPDPSKNPVITEIRDSITNEACQRACWLGIEAGVTTVDELDKLLDASGYSYRITEPRFLAYEVEWAEASFLVQGAFVHISIKDGVVSQISMPIANPSSKESIYLFPELPDLVFANGQFNRLYAERNVVITIIGGVERDSAQSKTFILSLIDAQRTEEILGYGDIRPCALPPNMCGTPLRSPILSPILLTEQGLTISWSVENGVDWYTLSMSLGETILEQRVEIREACDESQCTITIDESLLAGLYDVKVRGQNLAQLSEWSNIERVKIIESE